MSAGFAQFADRVRAAGLKPVDRGRGHWQIKGGPLLVNYYPFKGTYYVSGTTGGKRGGWDDAIAASRIPPSRETENRDKRRMNYRGAKNRLLKHRPFCHWCKKPLTRHTATLEHIIPLDRGGLDNANNWTLACAPCNHARGNNMPELAATVLEPKR